MPSSADRRVVVVNATPIIALSIIDQLSLFRDLYGRVLIPTAVRRLPRRGAFWAALSMDDLAVDTDLGLGVLSRL